MLECRRQFGIFCDLLSSDCSGMDENSDSSCVLLISSIILAKIWSGLKSELSIGVCDLWSVSPSSEKWIGSYSIGISGKITELVSLISFASSAVM